MTLRDLIGAAVGASLSFALGLLATANDPRAVLWVGFAVTSALVVVFVIAEAWRAPWMGVEVTPLSSSSAGTLLRIAFVNYGQRRTDERISVVMVPDDVQISQCLEDGSPHPNPRVTGHTPESLDGKHESVYWSDDRSFSPGTTLLYLLLNTRRANLPLQVRIGDPRRIVTVSSQNIGSVEEASFARIRPWLWNSRTLSVARRRTRREWVLSAAYIAVVVVALQARDALGASWYAFAAFYLAVSAAVVIYYRRTR